MKSFGEAWNCRPELADALARFGFNATIGYGGDRDEAPLGIIVVKNGKVTSAGAYSGEALNRDRCATADSWRKWIEKGIDMMGLGDAYTSSKLKFNVGDDGVMLKAPCMVGSFIKSFSGMVRA